MKEIKKTMSRNKKLVEVRDLVKTFKVKNGVVHAVSEMSLDLCEHETLSLVGESGCGKSTFGRLLLLLIQPTSGSIKFEGEELLNKGKRELRNLRQKMQIVFQDPFSSLDPRMTVRRIVAEPLRAHRRFGNRAEENRYIDELLEKVGIQKEHAERYPHQFSGGQRQRICIARALALKPKLIICDEPVSALDISIQAQMLNLLHDLQDEFGLTYLFISHDLSVVRYVSDRICVMFLGRICEIGSAEAIFAQPKHPYTYFLLSSTPKPDPTQRREDKEILQGESPSPINPPSGCRFHTRCPRAKALCAEETPHLQEISGRHVACHFPL
jgi:oligopeptide transport system ATP-binding protein